jgi:hypothetical protein
MQEVPRFGLTIADYSLMLTFFFCAPILYELFRFEHGPYFDESDSESEEELDSDLDSYSDCESDSYLESDEDSRLTITTITRTITN